MRMNFATIREFDPRLLAVLVGGMVVRIAYAVAAPLSPDWHSWYLIGINFYYQPGQILGIYTLPPFMFTALYTLWLHLPISHPDPLSFVTFPPYGVPPYFQPTPGAILFVLIMKLPSLIADAVIAILFYKMLLQSGASKNRIYFAVSAWLFNPLTLILGNVNDVDTIPLMFVVFSAFLAERKKYGAAAFSLIVAGLMRLLAFIALPFLVVRAVRAREWTAVLATTVPIAVVFIPLLTWLTVFRPDAIALFQGRPGLYVPEALDVFGSVLQLHGTEYPENAIALTTLAYVVILALITGRSNESRFPGLVSAPLLVYTAFSWVWPSMLIYGIALALIQIARGKGYRILTIVLTLSGLLWILVQEGAYICKENVAFLFIPLYNVTLQGLSNQCLNLFGMVLTGGLSVPIRSVFSAVITLLIIRLVPRTVHFRTNDFA